MTSFSIVLLFSVALATLVVLCFLLLTSRRSKDASEMAAEKILAELEAKSRGSTIFWITENLLEPIRETRRLVSDFNPRSIVIFLRDVQVHLKPHWFCSQCGRHIRRSFRPLIDCSLDALLEKDIWLACARVSCLRCKPIFGSIEEDDV